jgi:hypothetical protein
MNSNPLKCVLDVRSVPPERFALPTDGRQRKHLCVQRQRLINLLATYANPDGTNCWPSRDTLAAALGQGVRTIARLLDDLETLGYMESKGLNGLRGPRIKNLNIATITGVQSSDAGVPSSQVGVPSSKVDVPSSKAGVPSTQPETPETREDGTRPIYRPSLTAPSNQRQNGGVEEFLKNLPSAMAGATDTRRHRAQIEAQLAQYGRDILLAALAYWIKNRSQEIETLRCKWNFWFQECAPALAAAPAYAKWLAEEAHNKTPEGRAAIEASIAVQKKAMVAFMDKEPPPQNGVDVSELFPELNI